MLLKIADSDKNLIRSTLDYFDEYTCVRFIQGYGPQKYYVKVTSDPKMGCRADVGYFYTAGQRLNLAPYCMNKGGITHEFLHALGFQHQHNAPDREKYISINETNISPLEKDNFKKNLDSEVTDLNYPYDYDSIMHYGPFEGSKNDERVITALKPGASNMGQRTGLSPTDIFKMNTLYDCPPNYHRRRQDSEVLLSNQDKYQMFK